VKPTAAGLLTLEVGYRDGHIAAIESHLQRPAAQLPRMLAGQEPEQALALVSVLFSLCGRAHAVAGARALDQARAVAVDPVVEAVREQQVRVERIRETGLRLLRDWQYPRASQDRIQRLLRNTQRLSGLLEQPVQDAAAVAQAVAALQAWWQQSKASASSEQWWIHGRSRDWQGVMLGGPTAVLDPGVSAALYRALAEDRDGGFCAAPRLSDGCRITGPVAAANAVCDGGQLVAGTLQALLMQLDTDIDSLAQPAEPIPLATESREPEVGTGWAWTARGWLLHRVALEAGTIKQWQILAPTDWNFHTEGALCQRLRGTVVERERVEDLVSDLVLAHAPCVGYKTRISDA
jgi:hypothetical protein